MKSLGYRNGFRYLSDGSDVWRNDYADAPTVGLRWFSTVAAFPAFLKAYGPLCNEAGEEMAILQVA